MCRVDISLALEFILKDYVFAAAFLLYPGAKSFICHLVFIQLIKVYGEDSHSRSVWVSPGANAREVCHMLVQTAHCSDQENWALLELHPALGLGKLELLIHI